MKKLLILLLITVCVNAAFAQHSDESMRLKMLNMYQDSLVSLGKKMVNSEAEVERSNANYKFIKTLVSALKINNSFLFKFDSVKAISILNSPDNKFRIFSWSVMNTDGSYRFYGSIQMNTGGPLNMVGFEDYTPAVKQPEDSVYTNREWYGAQYYQIIPVYGQKPYYVLLGWKGNTVESTKKVIDVISFRDNKPEFGMGVFDGNGKNRKRVVFEYNRNVSFLLKYIPEQNLIVFDHLAAPDKKSTGKPATYGPDLSYDGYKLKNGRWVYVSDLDMKNVAEGSDKEKYTDPRKQAATDRASVPLKKRP